MAEEWFCIIGDELVDGNFDSKEKAIEAGKVAHRADEYSMMEDLEVALFIPFTPSIDVEDLIENWQDDVYDEYYDCGNFDDYLESVTKEQKRELEDKLNDVIHEWVTKHNIKANFGQIEQNEVVEGPITCHSC